MAQPVAIVTGASSALGADLSRRLAGAGYALALHYHRNADAVDCLSMELLAAGKAVHAVQGNLGAEMEARQLIEAVLARYGRVDVLINNAGAYQERGLLELTDSEWFAGLNSTASATFFTTRAALPALCRAGRGRVINLGDSACERPTARDLAMGYHIGKVGVLMLTRSFAALAASDGVTVNMISPGYLENSVGKPPVQEIPAGRFGGFADVWNAAAFLLKPESGYLTGANLLVSGGWNLR